LSYDISFRSKDGVINYIEVKATASCDKSVFEVSWNELEFSRLQGDRFSFYRVFGVCSDVTDGKLRVCKINNPAQHLLNQRINLILVI